MSIYDKPIASLDAQFEKFDYLMSAHDNDDRKSKFEELRNSAKSVSDKRDYLVFSDQENKFSLAINVNRQTVALLSTEIDPRNGDIFINMHVVNGPRSELFVKRTEGGLLELRLYGEKNPIYLENRLLTQDIVKYLVYVLMDYINKDLERV